VPGHATTQLDLIEQPSFLVYWMRLVNRATIVDDLRRLSVCAGQVVFVHSSLSSLGQVQGGAGTLVDAFLEVIGPKGTLVVPTFTLTNGRADMPIFDLRKDRSEMGAMTEAVRTRPSALRSRHLLHSVAGLGEHAATITAVHGPSAWAGDGPFWQLYLLNARIVLLGVPYLRCTWFHVIEQLVQVRYRSWVQKQAWLCDDDGRIKPLPTCIYRSNVGFVGNDFNKFGALLEAAGHVQVGAVGNAMTRCFGVRAAHTLGVALYRQDPLLFVKTTPNYHPLLAGVVAGEPFGEKVVVDPALVFRG
jgi:aminoglycoside 3-N-acetyltransferase